VNGALVAGHVELQDNCILSGHSAVQQRVRVGRLAMIGGLGSSSKDVPPFVLQRGYNCITGLNLVGLRRSGCSPAAIDALRGAFRILFKEGRNMRNALDQIEADFGQFPEVTEFVNFIRQSKIGINPIRGRERRERLY
jgi:UDP-N-acetylglucosamine acyltransferase